MKPPVIFTCTRNGDDFGIINSKYNYEL
jgi:hypothetical protein